MRVKRHANDQIPCNAQTTLQVVSRFGCRRDDAQEVENKDCHCRPTDRSSRNSEWNEKEEEVDIATRDNFRYRSSQSSGSLFHAGLVRYYALRMILDVAYKRAAIVVVSILSISLGLWVGLFTVRPSDKAVKPSAEA